MGLSLSTYIALLVDEAGAVRTPSGPYRLIATRSRIEDCFESVLYRISQLSGAIGPGDNRVRDASDRALELASYLYAAGAPHPQWRRWAAITAMGLALQGQFVDAGTYAAVAGEWDLIVRMRSLPPGRSSMPAQLWPLLTGEPSLEMPIDGDDLDQGWYCLVEAIRIGDHARSERALREIVEWWWEEDEGDWVNFHPYSYPDFDAPVCAAAAVAKRHGYVPRDLSPDVRRYLDAGLADGYPDPLYPTFSPFNEPAEDA